jgi:hypothetical protein
MLEAIVIRTFSSSSALFDPKSGMARRFYFSQRFASSSFRLASNIVLVMVLIFIGSQSQAQTFYGSVSGIVKDPTGALVPEVKVTVRESNTTTEYKTVTNSSGAYLISFLKPGGYIVTFQKDGFAQYITAEFSIVQNQAAVIDTTLRLGSESQTVQVSGTVSSLCSCFGQPAELQSSNDCNVAQFGAIG